MTCSHCGVDAAALQAEVARLRARVVELEQSGEELAADARRAYDQRREMGREAQRLRALLDAHMRRAA